MANANNAKKGAVRTKRRERKNVAAGQAHIQSTFNNTVVTITDLQGNAISWCSSGSLNFRADAQKSGPRPPQRGGTSQPLHGTNNFFADLSKFFLTFALSFWGNFPRRP